MFVYKIIGVGIIGMVLSLMLKQYKKELAIAVPIITVVLLFLICAPYLSAVITMFEDIAEQAGVELSHMQIVIKIIGVAYICQFASDICRDAGESAIAGKIEIGGKVAIISLSAPIIYSLLSLVSDIINF